MGQKPELLLLRSDTKPDIDAVGFHHCGLMLVQAALAAKNAALLLRTQWQTAETWRLSGDSQWRLFDLGGIFSRWMPPW